MEQESIQRRTDIGQIAGIQSSIVTKGIGSGRNIVLSGGIIQNRLKSNEILCEISKEKCH